MRKALKALRSRLQRSSMLTEIREQAVPLCGWRPEDELDRVAVLHSAIQELLRRSAHAELACSENDRRHREELRRLFLSLIDVLDAFDRIFATIKAKEDKVTPQMSKWIGNFTTCRRLLENILARHGVRRDDPPGPVFDPQRQTVSEVIEDPSRQEGTIAGEAFAGYLWNGELLRKAGVLVVRNAPQEQNAPGGKPSDPAAGKQT